MQQISKIQWLKHGDENSAVFHQSIRCKRIQNNIHGLQVDGQLVCDASKIHHASLSFYSNMLCCKMTNKNKINMNIIHAGHLLND